MHDALAAFRRDHPPRPPKFDVAIADQLKPLPAEDVAGQLRDGSGVEVMLAAGVPSTAEEARTARHLWVIGLETEPYALEACGFGRALRDGVIKHTNLTGGGPAHCGGELWFLASGRICLNGDSGRYGPTSEAELMAAARAVAACGFEVGVMGWNTDDNTPMSVAVGEEDVTWL